MCKKLSGLLGCDSKEAAKNIDETACRMAVSGKFSTAMGKLSSATDCSLGRAPAAGDITTLEGVIETCRSHIEGGG